MSFIFVVFEMKKKKKPALFTVVLQLQHVGGPQSAFPRSTLLSRRAARGLPSFHFFLSVLRSRFRSARVSSLAFFSYSPAAALSSVSGNPFSTVRFIFSSTQPRLLASVHFLRGLAQSQLPAAAVTSEHTLESCACAHS